MHHRPPAIKPEPAARHRLRSWTGLLAALLLLAPAAGRGQESLRTSLADQQFTRTRQASAEIPYNIKLGPARLRFGAGFNTEYNDNINVAETGGISDVLLRPEANADLVWPITEQNTLVLAVGVGYTKYLDNPDSDSLYIRPGSALSFDVYVQDLRINLHERFSFYQDPIQQGAISGTNRVNSRYGLGENIVGVGLDWNLNKLVLSGGYDHMIAFATSSDFEYLDRSSDYLFVRTTGLLAPELSTGLEATAGFTTYSSSTLNDSDQYTLGPFVDWQLSQFMRLGARVGYQIYSFDTATNAADTSSYYATLTLEHELNRYVNYSLGGGQVVSLGVNSDAINLSFIRLAARWQVLRATQLTTDLFYEHGEETGSTQPETFNRFGLSLALSYRLTQKLDVGLRYQFTDKSSDVAQRSYQQNVIGINLLYRF